VAAALRGAFKPANIVTAQNQRVPSGEDIGCARFVTSLLPQCPDRNSVRGRASGPPQGYCSSSTVRASLTYLVLRVLPLGSEFGENAVNPRLAISPATTSWSLPISSDDGELA